MSLRVVRRKGTKTLYIRGTVRGVRCYEAAGTESRALAEAYKAKRETQLFEGALIGRRVAVSFGEAALSYLEFEPRSERTEYDVHWSARTRRRRPSGARSMRRWRRS